MLRIESTAATPVRRHLRPGLVPIDCPNSQLCGFGRALRGAPARPRRPHVSRASERSHLLESPQVRTRACLVGPVRGRGSLQITPTRRSAQLAQRRPRSAGSARVRERLPTSSSVLSVCGHLAAQDCLLHEGRRRQLRVCSLRSFMDHDSTGDASSSSTKSPSFLMSADLGNRLPGDLECLLDPVSNSPSARRSHQGQLVPGAVRALCAPAVGRLEHVDRNARNCNPDRRSPGSSIDPPVA